MYYYAIPGKSDVVCAKRSPSKKHIKMVGPNDIEGIARSDGTWSKPIKPTKQIQDEFISKYYNKDEQVRILVSGSDEEKRKLQLVIDKAKTLKS